MGSEMCIRDRFQVSDGDGYSFAKESTWLHVMREWHGLRRTHRRRSFTQPFPRSDRRCDTHTPRKNKSTKRAWCGNSSPPPTIDVTKGRR